MSPFTYTTTTKHNNADISTQVIFLKIIIINKCWPDWPYV